MTNAFFGSKIRLYFERRFLEWHFVPNAAPRFRTALRSARPAVAQAGAQQTYQPQQAVPQYNAGPSLVSQVYGKPKSKLEKLLILFSMIFFVLAALALLISLIRGIVDATDPFLGGFGTFLDVFFGGIYRAAIYSFMALALAVFKNRLK